MNAPDTRRVSIEVVPYRADDGITYVIDDGSVFGVSIGERGVTLSANKQGFRDLAALCMTFAEPDTPRTSAILSPALAHFTSPEFDLTFVLFEHTNERK